MESVMSARTRHDELLEAGLDGALTPAERAELERLLETSADARARAGELSALATLLDSLGPAEPPADLLHHVLARIAAPAATPAPARETGARVSPFSARPKPHEQAAPAAQGDSQMGRKVMWSVAAAAVLALVAMKFMGYPPTGPGAEGTIGAAARYQAPQIGDQDVAVAPDEAAVQAFMQSETFDLLVKDDNARALLGDASFRTLLASPEFMKALADPQIRTALASPRLAHYLSDPDLRTRLDSPELKLALQDPGFRAALDSPGLRTALNDANFRARLASPGFVAALRSPAFTAALADRGFAQALKSAQFVAKLR